MITHRLIPVTRTATLLCALAFGSSCGSDESALAGRIYLAKVPRGEVLGQWTAAAHHHPRATLQLAADDGCTLSPEMVDFLVECEGTRPAPRPLTGFCTWGVSSSQEGEAVTLTFLSTDRRWLLNSFSAYRHTVRGDLALLSTCGSGHAYGLHPVAVSPGRNAHN